MRIIDLLSSNERVSYDKTMESLDKAETLSGVIFYIAKARWILFRAERRYQKGWKKGGI